MATQNPAPLDTDSTSSTGIKIGYSAIRNTDGTVSKGLKRGFGGPTATNGTNVTNPLYHDASVEAFDDEWMVVNVDLDDSPTVELTNVRPNYLKKTEVFVLPSELGSTGGIYCGPESSVTATGTTRGRYIPPGASYAFPLGPTMRIWAVCATGLVAKVQVTMYA